MFDFMKFDIKKMFSDKKILLILCILVQVVSVIVIILSYGVINHYNTKIDEPEGYELHYRFKRNKEYDTETQRSYLDMPNSRKFLDKVLPLIENKLDYFFVLGEYNGYILQSSTGYNRGIYTLSIQLKERVALSSGEMFSEEEIRNGEKIIIAGTNMITNDDYIMLGDEKYKLKGVLKESGLSKAFFVPYGAIPDDANVRTLSFLLEKPLLKSEYDVIAETLRECFGDKVIIPEFDGIVNESNNRVYRDIIFVSVILMFVFAIDYCIIYRYILEKRRKLFAISRICGASKLKMSLVYMVELLSMSMITLIVGAFLFHNLILTRVRRIFEYIELYCDMDAYMMLSLIYMGILFVVYLFLIVKFVRKTPVSLMKEV